MNGKNVVDFSTKGSEYTKTYIELPECIKSKNCKSSSITIRCDNDNLILRENNKDLGQIIKSLRQQLATYKAKEDKIKNWLFENCDGTYDGTLEHTSFIYSAKPQEILAILNEGDK